MVQQCSDARRALDGSVHEAALEAGGHGGLKWHKATARVVFVAATATRSGQHLLVKPWSNRITCQQSRPQHGNTSEKYSFRHILWHVQMISAPWLMLQRAASHPGAMIVCTTHSYESLAMSLLTPVAAVCTCCHCVQGSQCLLSPSRRPRLRLGVPTPARARRLKARCNSKFTAGALCCVCCSRGLLRLVSGRFANAEH